MNAQRLTIHKGLTRILGAGSSRSTIQRPVKHSILWEKRSHAGYPLTLQHWLSDALLSKQDRYSATSRNARTVMPPVKRKQILKGLYTSSICPSSKPAFSGLIPITSEIHRLQYQTARLTANDQGRKELIYCL